MNSPDQPTPRDRPPRRIRYTLGSLLAFIAVMAFLLSLVVPFLKPLPPGTPASHLAMRSTTVSVKNCAACHAGMPANFRPQTSPHLSP